MKRLRFCAAAGAILLASVALAEDKKLENKLPDAVAKALEKAEVFEVYSLDGGTNVKDGWHGAKVLGKATVKAAADRKSLASAVKKGVEDGTSGARCFIPRHGVSVKYDGKTYDLVICFECSWVYIYTEGADKPLVLMTADSPQKTFNKILTDAKVPLAKSEKPEKPEK
jgi:hypothetical protein